MNLIELLQRQRLLAIVRGGNADAVSRCVWVLIEEGIEAIEISLTGADALDVISQVRRERFGEVQIGAGSIITIEDARRASDAGAEFGVTPGICPAIDASRAIGIPIIAGALTPSEVIAASSSAAIAIKLFPASLGGPCYLRSLLGPFPASAFVPVGGVDETAAVQYLAAGATAVGVGSPLLGDSVNGGSIDDLRLRAQSMLRAIAPYRDTDG